MHTDPSYAEVIEKTAGMVHDEAVRELAAEYGLRVVDLTWEDTARFDNSAVGPNISDLTIQVHNQHPGREGNELRCMPVIRYPNFSDVTGDLSPDEFFVLVGNEKGERLEKITLRELLADLRSHLHKPRSWAGRSKSLLAAGRDERVLVSAQACFLPIPRAGIAKFNPVLFNYQSRAGDPAVLAILATREGTSVTIIDNQRDAFEAGDTWGQRLFFNQNGKRASLTGRRRSDYAAASANGPAGATSVPEGLNMVLLIQVPLRRKQRPRYLAEMNDTVFFCCASAPPSDVEEAVIGHGETEGPFTEIDGLPIHRDRRYPIRVTVQFYKATSNGVVSQQDMADIASQIKKVYDQTEYVGSLVLDGRVGRPTEYEGQHVEPPVWWETFWQRHWANTGETPAQAMGKLQKLLGNRWHEATLAQAEGAIAETADEE